LSGAEALRRRRLGFVATSLRPGGSGVQTYVRELLGALSYLADADLAAFVPGDVRGELPSSVREQTVPSSSVWARTASALTPRLGFDLVHGLDKLVPLGGRGPVVVTIHDLAAYDVPWAFSGHKAALERVLVARSVRRADLVVVPSAFVAARVWERFHRNAFVTPEAPASWARRPTPEEVARARDHFGLPERFVLYVGNVEARKGLEHLTWALEHVELPLVVVGQALARATPGRLPPLAQVLGWLPSAELPGVFGAATLAVYPSLYEGFGLPPLEAARCGCPVVATKVGALGEVLGDAAVLVPPGDPESLATALVELYSDDERRSELAQRAEERVGRLSWQASALWTLAAYREVGVDLLGDRVPPDLSGHT